MSFTEAIIDELVACQKAILEPPTREFKEENRHRKKDMRLYDTADPKRLFTVFIRQSLEFAEDFSFGLIYLSPDAKRMTLVRFNGQHDQSNDPYDKAKMHFQYHIHKATPENLNNGRYDKHPALSSSCDYASFEEASAAFLATINLRTEDVRILFPSIEILPLFRNPGRNL
jgi:hypothetical protein